MAEAREDTPAFEGGCLCGAVRYAVAHGPAAQVLCFCDMCRRATGAPVPGFVSVEAARVTWSGAAPRVYRSSEAAERGFCGICGSALFYRSDGSATIALASGTADLDFRPTAAFHGDARPDWLAGARDLHDPGFSPGPREVS
jgi:hypothetical protein